MSTEPDATAPTAGPAPVPTSAPPAAHEAEQPTLPGLAVPRRRRRRPGVGGDALRTAATDPVARVVVDVPALHLDRPFDYTVPLTMDAAVRPGVRVKVRFGAQDVDGFVLERVAVSEHEGTLSPIRRVVSDEVVLTDDVLALCRAVADHFAGSLSDVLRLAVPARHARTESEPRVAPAPPSDTDRDTDRDGTTREPTAWAPYAGAAAFLRHVAAGNAPRAVWTALPGRWDPAEPSPTARDGWEHALVDAVRVAHDAGRGVLVVLPDRRDVDRLTRALEDGGLREDSPAVRGSYVRLLADDGAAARYRAFLALSRGEVRIAVGTRAAAFAPVADLGLAVCWDDADASHAEQRSPYPHTREVLALRSELTGCALLLGSHARSVEAQALLASGWAHEISAARPDVRARTPQVRAMTSAELASEGPAAAARIPSAAWRLVRDSLARGPVLVQVPRKGYVPVVACQTCRAPARCTACSGPLGLPAHGGDPQCTWCGRLAARWRCPECAGSVVRSVRVGSERTAEELGRAFPGVPVRVSSSVGAGVVDRVPARPALVVATPGAEPVADGGYAAALLLDAAVMTTGTSLRTRQDALHRWLSAASLVRAQASRGVVMVVGDGDPVVTGALVRWDPAGMAQRDLDERAELGLPPVVRVATVTGDRSAVDMFLPRLALPADASVLGPLDLGEDDAADGVQDTLAGAETTVRAIVRVPRRDGRSLAVALRDGVSQRRARREPGHLVVQMDVTDLV